MFESTDWNDHLPTPHMKVINRPAPYPRKEKIKDVIGGVSVVGIFYLLPTIAALIESYT